MFGIELYEFISFVRQLGLSVAGAACLWGFVFEYISRKEGQALSCSVIYEWIARRMMFVLYGGALTALIAWLILWFMIPAVAHEGITLVPETHEIFDAVIKTAPLYIAWVGVLLVGVIWKKARNFLTKKGWSWFYVINFLFVAVLISYYVHTLNTPIEHLIFYAFHGFHSIFTLGTVLVLDIMFLSSKSSVILQQHIFPLFPKISKVIWVGLALDSLSVLIIYPEAVLLTPRFFFAQTVVGILIINGVLLSGILTRKILSILKKGETHLHGKWLLFADVAGTISITSWMSITFVDFFDELTFAYHELFLIYLGVIIVLFVGHRIWEHFDTDEPHYHIAEA